MISSELIRAIASTAELCGKELSEGAAKIFSEDLEGYPEAAVLTALKRCRKELQRPLTLAAVIERIDDGRPGADEAWAMLPRDEATTTVWTSEMAEAWGVSSGLEDQVAARMAFKEMYSRIVATARAERRSPTWQVSLGHDRDARALPVVEAVRRKQITPAYAATLLPPATLMQSGLLEDKEYQFPESVKALANKMKGM